MDAKHFNYFLKSRGHYHIDSSSFFLQHSSSIHLFCDSPILQTSSDSSDFFEKLYNFQLKNSSSSFYSLAKTFIKINKKNKSQNQKKIKSVYNSLTSASYKKFSLYKQYQYKYVAFLF